LTYILEVVRLLGVERGGHLLNRHFDDVCSVEKAVVVKFVAKVAISRETFGSGMFVMMVG